MPQWKSVCIVSMMLSMISFSAIAETCKKPKFSVDPWLHIEPCKKQPKPVRAPEITLRSPSIVPTTTVVGGSNGSRGVLLIGDSLGVGLEKPLASYFARKGYAFSAVVKDSQRIKSFSEGEMYALFQTELAKRPSIVIVSLGTNDELAGSGYGPTAREAYTKVLTDIRAIGAQVYWIGPPTIPCVKEVDRFGKPTGRLVCPSGKVIPIIASTPNFFDSRPLKLARQSDGVHPTGKAYYEWASQIQAWLG